MHLTAVCLLRDYVTLENHRELLRDVSHKTRLEIEELLARRFLKADVPSRLRRQRTFEPLSEGRYCLQLSASRELKQKLELARDLMSHANPSGDLAIVVERALDALIEKLQSRRFAQAKSHGSGRKISAAARTGAGAGAGADPEAVQALPPSTVASTPSRAPIAVRSTISEPPAFSAQIAEPAVAEGLAQNAKGGAERLGMQTLNRPATRAESHHQRAWALGGADSIENLALMCRAHNRLLAERELGPARIAQAIVRARHRK